MLKKIAPKKIEFLLLLGILIATTVVYLNHFDNPFFFDDSHTISSNNSIKSLDNWTSFFTNAETFSSLPSNRAYRPWVTLMNAIDYKLGNGSPIAFHIHIFLWFLVLVLLIYILSKKLYHKADIDKKWIIPASLLVASLFGLHTVNAETVNYICARSDSFSTLAIVASLLLYIYPITRKYHIYLITMIIGIWTKQTGVIFFPILFVYILLFEESTFLEKKSSIYSSLLKSSKKIIPSALIASSLFIFNQYYLTPTSTDSTNNQVSKFEYISTQFYVIKHYLSNFLLPINLSADPDIAIIKPWYSLKILTGLLVVIILVVIMIKCAFKKQLRPVSFGLAWFFLALLPTTLNPLYQIANDHRMFFPFVGLFIAIPCLLAYYVNKYKLHKSINHFNRKIVLLIAFVICGYAYGTFQRNKVWDSSEVLWRDVSIKSPKNGRGLMNYGLALMAKGNYNNAEVFFNKALKLTPNWGTLHTNIAIINEAKGNNQKAVEHFNIAAKLDPYSPASYYYHARYLVNNGQYYDASKLLKKSLEISPNHSQSITLFKKIKKLIISPEQEINKLIEIISKNPTPENYLKLSIKYSEFNQYEQAINSCLKILEIDPNNTAAYNNICVAYNHLKKWELGAKSCMKAIAIDPNFQLAKNNLNWAKENINVK